MDNIERSEEQSQLFVKFIMLPTFSTQETASYFGKSKRICSIPLFHPSDQVSKGGRVREKS
jgi:hypothetical protein